MVWKSGIMFKSSRPARVGAKNTHHQKFCFCIRFAAASFFPFMLVPPYFCSCARDAFILSAICLQVSAMEEVPFHAFTRVSMDIFSHTTVSME